MLNTRLLFSNLGDNSLETIRKRFALGLKLVPAMLELAMTSIIDCLPIIVYDKICNINVVLFESFNSLDNFVFGEPLTKSVPSTLRSKLCECMN